ncbi:rhamnulokinase [Eubacterium sp. am_0171]|uniref:rhamnulokinase n=1 Tax=unclassified Eubacterium (in: firmicutes) TaxID=2624479 RepID=UPI001020592B|nr:MULTISPECIES: FGGY family carbohydrate kinase [unclassified Eubacterium (in: firmicutes)]MSC85279.1 rhamnulokinase [Eubacterium sp. BIOML-A1]MSD07757.1 rhamnulokinase [Eubacterium sp. BIOML-A2]RYT13958.1 rhamnulokinase [Eubacterium sp. am_0171]
MRYLAFDLGASSGKLLLGDFNGSKLKMQEIHRFPNHPINMGRGIYWDYLYIYSEMIKGIRKAHSESEFVSMGIDGFCNDFSFISKDGELLSPVRAYRDGRTKRCMEKIKNKMPDEELYKLTGNLSTSANTRIQLAAMQEEGQAYIFEKCDKMLFLPDLLLYYLTGEKIAEFTLSSVSQLMSYQTKQWDTEILNTFSIPERMMGNIVNPGVVIGKSQCKLEGLDDIKPFNITTVCEHDTASAFAPFLYSENEAVISSGTWTLCGVPISNPINSKNAMNRDITNEGNMDGKYFLVKSIMGTWLIQETIRDYELKGFSYGYNEIDAMISETKPFSFAFDVDDEELFTPGNMIRKIRNKCYEFNGMMPDTPGEIFRCIQECMAFKCRLALDELQEQTHSYFSRIHIIDGGSKDSIFCSYIANVCNKQVYAGMNFASAAGNVLVQMIGHHEISSLEEGCSLLQDSILPKVFEPKDVLLWNERYYYYLEQLNNQ